MYIQTKVRDRRERFEQPARMAIEQHKAHIEFAKMANRPRLVGATDYLLFEYYAESFRPSLK